MTEPGPSLESLMRRLVETPPEFLAEPAIGRGGQVDVAAVVWDVLRGLGGEPLATGDLAAYRPRGRGATQQHRNRLRLVLLGCWLLADEWFGQRAELSQSAQHVLEVILTEAAEYLAADRLLADAQRREELIRRILWGLDLRPAGESEAQAADRLQTLDSAERQRVLREAAKAENRARMIREAMDRAAAQDAASRYTE